MGVMVSVGVSVADSVGVPVGVCVLVDVGVAQSGFSEVSIVPPIFTFPLFVMINSSRSPCQLGVSGIWDSSV